MPVNDLGPGLGVLEVAGKPRRDSITSSIVVDPGLGLFVKGTLPSEGTERTWGQRWVRSPDIGPLN